MKNQRHRPACGVLALMAGILFCLPSCSQLAVRPAGIAGQAAGDWLAVIRSRGSGLKTSKGIGRFSFRDARRRQSARFAWAAQYPSKIRLQVFTVTGQPQLILAADGAYVQVFSVPENRVYRKSAGDPLLQKIIDLPVSLEDVIQLLLGRIPLRPYLRADVRPAAAGKGWVIRLKKSWGSIGEEIYLDAQRRVQRLQFFSLSGKPAYGVRLAESRRIGGFDTPRRLVLTGPGPKYIQLVVERFWVNPEIPPAVFRLKVPA